MHIYALRCEMVTRNSLEDTFAVFEDPYNLAKITPPWLNFRVTSPGRVQMRKGAEITYVIRWLGVPIHWRTIIREYHPPFFFVDEQAKGPYQLWVHRHTFAATEGGTRIADEVRYALPFGWAGRLVHALMVKRQLEAIFRFRQRRLAEMLGAGTVETRAPEISA